MTVVVISDMPPPRKPTYQTSEREQYLRDNYFVDVAQLSVDIGLTYRYTYAIMRRLGLRRCKNSKEKLR